MPLGSGHVQTFMIDGLSFCELRHEVSSKKEECVMLYSLESRDVIGAEEKISVAYSLARCPLRQASTSPDIRVVPIRSQCRIVLKFESWDHEGLTIIDDVSKIQNLRTVFYLPTYELKWDN